MEKGYQLKEDTDFEIAKSKGLLVEVMQGTIRIFSPSPIEGYSSEHVAVKGTKVLRIANQFYIA